MGTGVLLETPECEQHLAIGESITGLLVLEHNLP